MIRVLSLSVQMERVYLSMNNFFVLSKSVNAIKLSEIKERND